ncbi:DUF1073 domain-containing protein [Bradyrhizobium genosp. L]|uniref:DUF1073 domain-containing protein n=1 Tax=Bradyrhizobium genosp. L TaxID=83637 RepID=UPI0018A32E27|nr:DUF1073 domain-containing protein [Bradyrhizobium genosp. L]QPF81658.1 DUF1073 domain-containing protein [Bradyrhizobium genosp. L]
MDQQPNVLQFGAWAGSYYGGAFAEGMEFLGYPYLSELAQRPEYRRIVEITATEMTRKWIRLHSTGDDKNKADRLQKINAEMTRLGVQRAFKKVAEQDGFFGRGHLYLDTGATDDPGELITPIGDGRDKLSKKKVAKGSLKAVRAVEAVWTYPTNYNSNDPLKGDWYNPDVWFVMGKRIHASRLLPFIGREVPDLLKPAYSFGGLSLTQMAKPYVDNWLQTRQSVNDAVSAFSVFCLKTTMSEMLQAGGDALTNRAELFNNFRNNRGLMLLDKEAEEFANVSSPLADLDKLQAQSQEHMASVSGLPLLKLLGIQPAGLNTTSEGELRSFYDWIAACQEGLFRANLTRVIDFVQLSLFGDVDEEITFEFVPLWALNEKEEAEVEKIAAETAEIRINSGVISPSEERQALASRPDSPYEGLDPDDAPDLLEEEEEGLEPRAGAAKLALGTEEDDESEADRKAA